MPTKFLATVKATGQMFIVIRRELIGATVKVHCWGDLVSYKGLSSKHEGQRCFLGTAVEVREIAPSEHQQLLVRLFEQTCAAKRAAGHVLEQRGRTVVDCGTADQVAGREKRAAAIRERAAALFGPSRRDVALSADPLASARRMLGELPVTRGDDEELPEQREEVVEQLTDLALSGGGLQRFSNGEFISSSLAVGVTFEDCARVPVLDGASHLVHFCPKTEIFWRRGGCMD